MIDMLTDWRVALSLVNLVLLLGIMAFHIWNRRLLRHVQRQGRIITAKQRLIEEVARTGPIIHQLAGAASWRDLDPASRAVFRTALQGVLDEMKAMDN